MTALYIVYTRKRHRPSGEPYALHVLANSPQHACKQAAYTWGDSEPYEYEVTLLSDYLRHRKPKVKKEASS